MSDDENESEETAVYTITSQQGLDYDSTETVGDLVFQIHTLVLGACFFTGFFPSIRSG